MGPPAHDTTTHVEEPSTAALAQPLDVEGEAPPPSGGSSALKGLGHPALAVGADIGLAIIDQKLQDMRRSSDFEKIDASVQAQLPGLYNQLLDLQARNAEARGYALVHTSERIAHIDTPDFGGFISDQYTGATLDSVEFTTTPLPSPVYSSSRSNSWSPEYTETTETAYTIDLGRFSDEQLRDYLKSQIAASPEGSAPELTASLQRIEGRLAARAARRKRDAAEAEKREKVRVRKVMEDEAAAKPQTPPPQPVLSLALPTAPQPIAFLPGAPGVNPAVEETNHRVDLMVGRRDWLVATVGRLRTFESNGGDTHSDEYRATYAEYVTWRDAWIAALKLNYQQVAYPEAHDRLDKLMGWYSGDGQRVLAEVSAP
jgi:hypothetical protein